jgi:hypothetical protein
MGDLKRFECYSNVAQAVIPCFERCSLSFSAIDTPFCILEGGRGSVGVGVTEAGREDAGGGAKDGRKLGAWVRDCVDANAWRNDNDACFLDKPG